MPLADEIAVLDGLDFVNTDGRIGRTRATGGEYARRVAPGLEVRRNVLDFSEGANYSGGSSYADGLPLLPSNAGLADADADLLYASYQHGVLPPKSGVVDYSDGGNYSGGSSFTDGLPLLPSNAGLADLNQMFDSYGSSMSSAEDGRIGQESATGQEYARQIAPGVETRRNVLDYSEGANYSGGSSWHPHLPLTPSNAGLAGLSYVDALDAVPDSILSRALFANQKAPFARTASKAKVSALRAEGAGLARKGRKLSPAGRKRLAQVAVSLNSARNIRQKLVKQILLSVPPQNRADVQNMILAYGRNIASSLRSKRKAA